MSAVILTGPAFVGHIFRDEAEAIERALPALVQHYAQATGLDVHPAEVRLAEVRGIDRRNGQRARAAVTEVRLGDTVIGSWSAHKPALAELEADARGPTPASASKHPERTSGSS